MTADVLDRFSPATREWFRGSFAAPTAAQAGAWDAISSGDHALVVAPTGSGKTLSAFLWALDRLASEPPPAEPLQALPGPLRLADEGARRRRRAQPALAAGRHRPRRDPARPAAARHHRRGPLRRHPCQPSGGPSPARPSDVLITTPESLFLMLTSQAREALAGVETVILDEVHAVAGTKRGAHLALSLERLDALLEQPGPAHRAVRHGPAGRGGGPLPRRRPAGRGRAAAVDQGVGPRGRRADRRHVRARARSPATCPGRPPAPSGAPRSGRTSRSASSTSSPSTARPWSSPTPAASPSGSPPGSTRSGRSGSTAAASGRGDASADDAGRRAAAAYRPPHPGAAHGPGRRQRAARPPVLARAHHGSVSKEQRAADRGRPQGRAAARRGRHQLARARHRHGRGRPRRPGRVPAERGQRAAAGRPGRPPGRRRVAAGVLFPKFRGDLVQTAVVVERMRAGAIESLRVPANPRRRARPADRRHVRPRRLDRRRRSSRWSAGPTPFATLPRSILESVLDMLAGPLPQRRVRRAAAAHRLGPR